MGWIIFALIIFITLLILSILFDVVQYAVLSIVGVIRTIVSFSVTGFNSNFFVFAILTSLFLLFAMGLEAFESGTKGDVLFRKISDGVIEAKEDINHPIQGLIGTILVGLVFAGIEYIIFWLSGTFVFMTIICIIESIVAVISLIQAIRFWWF